MDFASAAAEHGPFYVGCLAVIGWLLKDRAALIRDLKASQTEAKASQKDVLAVHERRAEEREKAATEYREHADATHTVLREFAVKSEAVMAHLPGPGGGHR